MDKHSLEIIIEICFLINELKHQFYSGDPWQVKMMFNREEEIRHCFDALIRSFDMVDFQRKYSQIRETVHLHHLINSTTETQYDRKQKVLSFPESLQSALIMLHESLT